VDQLEFADVVILNKVDLATPHELATVRSIVRSHNCRARIVETTNAIVGPRDILDTGRFSFEAARRHPAWSKEVNRAYHKPETEEYAISSFVYRAREPFDPTKLHAFFNWPMTGVLRAKGFFWLATRSQWIGELSHAGSLIRHHAVGRWWAAIPRQNWPRQRDLVNRIGKGWHNMWGDRRQELVFIGSRDMDQAAITAALDDCLLKLPPSGAPDWSAWARLPDPLARWPLADAASAISHAKHGDRAGNVSKVLGVSA
jgi:G3E family GTPase